DAHRIGVHRPMVGDPRQRRELPFHQLLPGFRRTFETLLHGWWSLLDVEALARHDADALHLREDRLIGEMRWMELQQLGGISEVLARRHGVGPNLRGLFPF